MRKLLFAVSAIFILLLTACGNKKPEPVVQGAGAPYNTPATFPTLSSDLPADQRNYLQEDLQRLSTLNLPASQDSALLGINDFSGATLSQWINTRIHLIVSENFDWRGQSNPQSIDSFNPVIFGSLGGALDDSSGIVTVMMNVGSYLYLQGKSNDEIYSLNANGTTYQVKSPRAGIIQVGEGLFTVNQIPDTPADSMANSFLRLSVLFHEARHDDGNGDYAGFPHATCASGNYAGHAACEENINGPYNVETVMLKEFYSACTNCSSIEQQALQLFIADTASRLQYDAEMRDDRPEGIQ